MPSAPRPKQFVATVNFTTGGKRYRVGDPVTDRRTIDRLVRRGSRFIKSNKPAPAEPSAEDSATPPAESPKED